MKFRAHLEMRLLNIDDDDDDECLNTITIYYLTITTAIEMVF